MRAVAVVVVAALLASVIAQDQCTGLNVTWTPGVQPLTLTKSTQTQACPYGTYKDTTQGGRCITYRQGINNFMGADCYTDDDCTGSGSLPLGCGSDKKCTWKNTRALGDSCTDNINCWSYVNNPAVNSSSIPTYCHATDKKCVTQVHVLVPAGQRCNYTANHQIFKCDAASTCRYYTTPANPQSQWGAGICVPLLTTNQVCGGNIKIPDYQYNDLWCGSGNVCYGQFPNNRTCQASRKQGETCYVYGQELECDQSTARLYCNGVSKTCVPYVGANTNCTGAYGSGSTSGDMCQNGLRCLLNNVLGYRQCAAANSVGQVCTQSTTDINVGNNCTTGLQCIYQPLRGHYTSQCSAGANGDVCQIFGGTPPALIDSCQPGLFCQQYAPANYTCIPKFTAGTFCNASSQCQDGIACLNSTCTVYQTVGQPCNELLTNPLNRLQCNPSLQCSRGMCINNYTVPIGGWCSQDRDCENAHCDVFYKKCTRRKLCSSSTTCGGSRPCACSAGAENMGQCMMDTCGKASNALRDCLTPLEYNPFSNSSFFPNSFSNPAAELYVFQDTQSSFYSKCAQQHNDYISCRALMAKWGAPAVALGDFAPAYNLQVAGASSVTVSVVVMIAFVMSVIMNL